MFNLNANMTKLIFVRNRFLEKYNFSIRRNLIRNLSVWSEASTLILISKNNRTVNNDDKYDYRLLMAKRSSQSSFMSNAYIFPGGKLDRDDFSYNWVKIFGHIEMNSPANRPPIFTDSVTRKELTKSENTENLMSTDLALRIAAVRETFEETGILLAKSDYEEPDSHVDIVSGYREKLRNSLIKFSDLCIKQKIRPDVSSLYEWSNWMTPEIEKKRFDTLFYIAFIDSEPDTHTDERELSKPKWCTPEDMLNKYYNSDNVLLAPPQVYELSRLKNITRFDELKRFAIDRQKLGLERWLPIIILKDSEAKMDLFKSDFIITLPGDSHEVNDSDSNVSHNRTYIRDTANGKKFFVECNVQLPFGQLSPIS